MANTDIENVDSIIEKIKKKKEVMADNNIEATDIIAHDNEMNSIIAESMDSYKELMRVGHNADGKSQGEIFSSAATFLKICHDASNSKMEKRLRIAKLKLDAKKVALMTQQLNSGVIDMSENEQQIYIDRNALLKQERAEKS